MAKKKGMAWQELAFWLVVIGALNWGLLGLVGFNAVSWLVGMVPGVTRLVYLLVGLSGVYLLYERRS